MTTIVTNKILPTQDEIEERISDKTFTPLDRFIWEYEPTPSGEKEQWRKLLQEAIESL